MIDGKKYFPAAQCARILGYTNSQKAVRDHCDEDGVTKRSVIYSLGRTQEMKFINEGNLYRLVVRSKLPATKKFERWVFDEVLPKTRRTGGYGSVNIEEVISWNSHPTMVLIEPPPLLESVAGRKYHYPHTFHCRSGKLFQILKLHIYRLLFRGNGVLLLWLTIFRPPV